MSSILDALKKAEHKSTVENGRGTPWPALPDGDGVGASSRKRLWVFLAGLLGVCAIVMVVWMVLRPETDTQTAVADRAAQPVAAQKPKPSTSPERVTRQPVHQPAADALQPPPPAPAPQKKMIAAAPPAPPAHKPRQRPVPTPSKKSSAPPRTRQDHSKAQASQPAKAEPAPRQSAKKARPESRKTFRNDKRIDLQALVWAPTPQDRFVVINNRLIKEGASIDNITVVRIGQDDVLFAEGNDRWHQAFSIR